MNDYVLLDFIPMVFFIALVWMWYKINKKGRVKPLTYSHSQHEDHKDNEDLSKKDSEGDGLMSEGDIMFPSDDEEE